MTTGQATPKTSPPDRRTRFRAEASSAREGTPTAPDLLWVQGLQRSSHELHDCLEPSGVPQASQGLSIYHPSAGEAPGGTAVWEASCCGA